MADAMTHQPLQREIVHLDLFSGAGGFAEGFRKAGYAIKRHYFSEIDKHAIANYRYNFNEAEYVGSVTDVRGRDLPERPTLITFGSPCQDFSLAGKRRGLDGDRSSLIEHAIRLVDECRPDVFVWENVKGAFSSNRGADFWAIIQAFAHVGRYRLEWQLTNGAWLLPQNRERIYLVGHLGNGGGRNVFPFAENNTGANEGAQQAGSVRTLTAGGHSGGLHSSMTLVQVRSATAAGYETATEGDSINLSQPNSETRRGRVGHGVAQTLETSCQQAVVAGGIRGRNPENPKSRESGLPTEQMFEQNENPSISNTLTSVGKDNVVVQLNPSKESGGRQPYQHNRVYDANGLSPALDQGAGRWGVSGPSIRRLTEIECERLQGFDTSWRNGSQPRNWTKWGINDKGETIQISRTQRYKMMGNAVMVDMVAAIAERL